MVAKRWTVNLLWFAVAELIIGFAALLMLPVFERMPFYFVNLFDLIVKNRAILELLKFLFCSMVMILPTIVLGSLLPMATQICTRNYSELGNRVGTIYSVNTLGNIIGSFMAGFILIPATGIQHSIIISAALNVAVGCALFLISQPVIRLKYRMPISFASAAVGVTLCLWMANSPWDRMIITSGPAVYAQKYSEVKGDLRRVSISGAEEKLLYYKEGTDVTVSVKEWKSGTIVMAVDGKVDASNAGDMYTQMLLGHLPLLLKPDAKTALVIGLGGGITLSTAALYPLTWMDCVEIEPAVVEASEFFRKENRDVLRDPRVNMIINDGRNYLTVSPKKYDVIISEPSNLWLAGIANLFTLDFYEICKKRLNPDGVMCQWSHSYYMSPEDLKIVINTFKAAFPYTSIWFSIMGDILMIGSSKELVIDYLELAKRYNVAEVREDLLRLGMREPLALLSCYLLDEEGVERFVAGSRINSDNHPVLEFSVPRSMYVDISESNQRLLSSFRTREFPEMRNFDRQRVTGRASFWYHLGMAYDGKNLTEEAYRCYNKAISVDAKFSSAYVGLALDLYKENKVWEAMENLKKAIAIDPSGSEAYYNLAQMYQNQGLLDDARLNYEYAIKHSPQSDRYREKLSELLTLMKSRNSKVSP